jgi:hypothetical protein
MLVPDGRECPLQHPKPKSYRPDPCKDLEAYQMKTIRLGDLSEILCLGHNMSPRSMYATQNQDQPGR